MRRNNSLTRIEGYERSSPNVIGACHAYSMEHESTYVISIEDRNGVVASALRPLVHCGSAKVGTELCRLGMLI